MYISMHRTSIIGFEYAPYYPTTTADPCLQIVEYQLTHKCLSKTFNTTKHSADYLERVQVRLEKLTDTLMPLPRTNNTTPSPTSHHKWWSAVQKKQKQITSGHRHYQSSRPSHRKTKRCLLKVIQFLGTSLSDP